MMLYTAAVNGVFAFLIAGAIIFTKDGVVAESGTPTELLENDGIYAQMVKLQNESQCWRIN